MSAILLQNGKQAFTDANSRPLAGGKVFFYMPGTNTLKDTWQDSAQTILNTNPVILNARGEASIYGSGPYRQVLRDASDVLIWDAYLPDLVGSLQAAINDIYSKNSVQVENIVALRALDKTLYKNAGTLGYYARGDGGNSSYYLDATDTTSADNGGSLIVATDGGRWKLYQPSAISVRQFGAKGDWDGTNGTDDTAAFQAAIDYRAANGGGEVQMPPAVKAYRWNSQVYLKPGVRLLGCDTLPLPNFYVANLADFYGGYCVAITWGAGSVGTYSTTTGCALRMSPGSALSGLKFIHPGQASDPATSTPILYPPVISAYDNDAPGGLIENLYFVNAYRAIYFPGNHGELKIKSVWGQIIEKFITLGGAFNADQVEDVNASGIFYLRTNSGSGFDSSHNGGLWSWIQKNGIAFDIGYADAIRFTDCFVGNCLIGIRFGGADTAPSSAASPRLSYGDWIGGGMEGVTFPVYVETTANPSSGGLNSNGFRFSGTGIAAVGLFNASRAVPIVMGQRNANPPELATGTDAYRGKMTYTGCNFWGSVYSASGNTGILDGVVDAVGGDIEFIGCTFKVQENFVARAGAGGSAPIFKFGGCTFNDVPDFAPNYYHFVAEAGSQGRFFYDPLCEFRKSLRTTSASASAYIQGATLVTVTSASVTTIPRYGDFITINGTTSMSNLVPIRPAGTRITLYFNGSLTVLIDGNIKLLANTAVVGGSTIDLISSGANWYRAG